MSARVQETAPEAIRLETAPPWEIAGWDDFAGSHPRGSVFHSADWARVLECSYGYSPRYLLARTGSRITFGYPVMEVDSLLTGKRFIALPFSDYCDPLSSSSTGKAVEDILKVGEGLGWNSIELRLTDSIPGEHVTPYLEYFHHLLPLGKDSSGLFSEFSSATRRNIHKGEREGVRVGIANTIDDVNTFYRFICMTRKRHGLPPQPYLFFRKLYELMLTKGTGNLFIAHHRGTPVAGAIFLHFGNKAFFKYGASDMGQQHLRGNNLILWEAIRHYSGNGYESLCFGRNEEWNQGLRHYKQGWGTLESRIRYYKYLFAERRFVWKKNLIQGFHNRFFRILPIPALRILGAALYRHIA
jgi:hypothetical protein